MGKILEGDGKAILSIFIGAIIAVVCLGTIADSIYTQTNTFTNANETVTAPVVNGTLDLTGRELVTQVEIYNNTNISQSLIGSGGSLQTGTATSGTRTVQLAIDDNAVAFAGLSVNVSYIYNPEGYLSLGGARSIQSLILIIGALAILIFVIVVLIKSGSLGILIKRR